MKEEGWCVDIASNNKTHYYKNKVSLCGVQKQKHYFNNLQIREGNKWAQDCRKCIKIKEKNEPKR